MDHKAKIEDYEPLIRAGSTKRPFDDEDPAPEYGFATEFKSKERTEPSPFVDKFNEELHPAAIKETPHEAGVFATSSKALLRSGHGLTVIGLFLFTVILYFRPYEIIPGLMFLRNIAFWIALGTVLVYIPTQLGLEGVISVKVPEVGFVCLLGVAALLSVPFAVDPSVAWPNVVDYLKVVLIFVVLVNVVRTEKRLKALMMLSILAAIISSVVAINDYRTGNLLMSQQRIRGFLGNLFDNPNDLALHLVTMVPIVVCMAFGSRAISKKLLLFGLAFLFAGGIVATTSRGGMLGLGAVMGVVGWKLAKKYRALLGAAGVSLIFLVVLFGPGGLKSRIAAGNDGSAMARTDDLKRSIFLSIRHPIFGLGMSNYPLYSNTAHASHNAYTQVSAELGIPALICYVMFLVTPLKRSTKIRSRIPPGRRRTRAEYLMIGLESSIIGYMVTSFFLSVAFLWYAYYLVGFAIVFCRMIEHNKIELLGSPAAMELSPTSVPRPREVMARNSI